MQCCSLRCAHLIDVNILCMPQRERTALCKGSLPVLRRRAVCWPAGTVELILDTACRATLASALGSGVGSKAIAETGLQHIHDGPWCADGPNCKHNACPVFFRTLDGAVQEVTCFCVAS